MEGIHKSCHSENYYKRMQDVLIIKKPLTSSIININRYKRELKPIAENHQNDKEDTNTNSHSHVKQNRFRE